MSVLKRRHVAAATIGNALEVASMCMAKSAPVRLNKRAEVPGNLDLAPAEAPLPP